MLFLDREHEVFEQENRVSTCPSCGHDNVVERATLSYFRFAFLPMMPLKGAYSLFCYRCCRNSEIKKSKVRIPLFNVLTKFLGLAFLLAMILYIFQQYKSDLAQQQALLTAPQKFDHYLLDESLFRQEATHQPRFMVAKVVSRDEQNVDLVLGNYNYIKKHQVIKAIRLDNMLNNGYFSKETVSVPISELSEMWLNGVIYGAYRPENLSLFGGLVMRPQLPKTFKPKLPSAINRQAVDLYHLGFHDEAFALFLQEAELGDVWAQVNLAEMYRDGEGTSKDIQQAIFWFKQAVLQNNISANRQLKSLCEKRADCD